MKNKYKYHKPSQKAIDVMHDLRERFSKLDEEIHNSCINCREKSMALDRLEEAAMWIMKGIAHTDSHAFTEE